MSSTLEDRRIQVCAEALTWLGTPYHHHAGVKGSGVDCGMLLVRVFGACGLVPAELDPGTYSPDWHMHRGEEKFAQWCERFGVLQLAGAMLPGDVLLYRFGRTYSHGAIYLGNAELVHARRKAGRVERASLLDAELSDRPMLRYRAKGLC